MSIEQEKIFKEYINLKKSAYDFAAVDRAEIIKNHPKSYDIKTAVDFWKSYINEYHEYLKRENEIYDNMFK